MKNYNTRPNPQKKKKKKTHDKCKPHVMGLVLSKYFVFKLHGTTNVRKKKVYVIKHKYSEEFLFY